MDSSGAYLNTDLKSWSIGTIYARSHDGRLYQILTENGLIISRNHVFLRPTRVEPVDRLVSPHISNVKADKPIIAMPIIPMPQKANLILSKYCQNQ